MKRLLSLLLLALGLVTMAGCKSPTSKQIKLEAKVDDQGHGSLTGTGTITWSSIEDPGTDLPDCDDLLLIPHGYDDVMDFTSVPREIVAKAWNEDETLIGDETSSGAQASLDWDGMLDDLRTRTDIDGGLAIEVTWTVDLLDVPSTATVVPQEGYISIDCDSEELGDEDTAVMDINDIFRDGFLLQMQHMGASVGAQAAAATAWAAIVDEVEENGVSQGVVDDLQSNVINQINSWIASAGNRIKLAATANKYKAILQDKL